MIGLLKGMHATISHLLTRKVTVQYPEQKPELPERSRGLIRLRLKKNLKPRCISCTFCEQVCPAIAIKIVYDYEEPGKVWTLDAGAGPMLSYFNQGAQAVGMEPWPENPQAKAAPTLDGCLAASFVAAEELTPMVVARTARKHGIWLSQAFGVTTFYDQLGGGSPDPGKEEALPEVSGAVEGVPAIITGSFGTIDPESIDAYAGAGGYQAMTAMLTGMTPAEVVEEISVSGLRGRGGAGFPTGRKWKMALDAEAPRKYVVCNGGDGDVGSFKDRAIFENNPHAVIEGMITAGYAVGAGEGYICMNAADRTAVDRMSLAVKQAEEKGLLGQRLPGTQFVFNVKMLPLPEAFAGGEETALLNVIEGKRAQPRVRPPYPAQKGLFGKPTVVDNAETLATIPWIIENGARKFQEIGAPGSPGTRLFTLSGAVARPGIYEAPMNISLKKLVEQGAGGFIGEPRAALVGGTGGALLPPGLFDIPLDYETLREAGGDLSSGAIEVLDAGQCVPDKVRQCLAFSSSQACGKCVPDRLGTWRLLQIVERICSGDAGSDDLELARELAEDVAAGSLCCLGRGAVRPLLTALEFFPADFTEHGEGKCAEGRCGR
ncbi:MAG: SLBB domain-containing protein [Thermoleophilia bacterium]|nr:SLBB domain-containing protein [Thermoleophilia bacterium]